MLSITKRGPSLAISQPLAVGNGYRLHEFWVMPLPEALREAAQADVFVCHFISAKTLLRNTTEKKSKIDLFIASALKMSKTIAHARVSTDERDRRSQKYEILAYCDRQKW